MNKIIIILVLVLLVSLLIIVSCKGKDSSSASELKEVSTELDLRNFKPFLNTIIPLIDSGFTNSEIDMIFNEFQDLKRDTENNYNFKIKYEGNESIMRFKVVKEDSDIVNLFIFSVPNLSDKINKNLLRLFEEKGL